MDPAAVVADCDGYSEPFDANLGIASIFVVAVLSAVGFLLPAVISRHKTAWTQLAIAAASAAGAGVLLCVALVHILADAESDLSSPCLPRSFTSAFPNWACLITSVTVMLMVIMDYLLQEGTDERPWKPMLAAVEFGNAKFQPNIMTSTKDVKAIAKERSQASPGAVHAHGHDHGHSHHSLPEDADLALKRGAVVFVEASVCTHSIPVGLSLGLQGGSAFVSLFIAVVIYQMLEGLGVGAAALEGQFTFKKLLLLAASFSLTAPAGIALGVGLHYTLNQNDARYLMALGIVNAMAAGMLLYVAIEHMNALSNHGNWLRKQAWWKQGLVLLSFCAGGAALIITGKWA